VSDQATIRAAQIGLRATVIGAAIAAVASLTTSSIGLATELASNDSVAGGARQEQVAESSAAAPVSCVRSLDAVMDFVKKHPRAGRVYARAGSGRPRLAAKDVIDACGDPETLVEETGVPRRR
jgi:hypothetical protein